jgi:hypothetical protein
MTRVKPIKKGGVTKGSAPPPLRSRLPDEEEHQKHLDRARSERERLEIERIRDVLAASRQKLLR